MQFMVKTIFHNTKNLFKRGECMNNLEWLLQGEPVIVHLVKKYILEESSFTYNQGFIQQYLERYNAKTLTWGDGFYGPKWISTHYT